MVNDRTGQDMSGLNKHVMEINPSHRIIVDLNALRQVNNALAEKVARQVRACSDASVLEDKPCKDSRCLGVGMANRSTRTRRSLPASSTTDVRCSRDSMTSSESFWSRVSRRNPRRNPSENEDDDFLRMNRFTSTSNAAGISKSAS